MDGGYLGEIRGFGGNFAPRGWSFCGGQLLPIAQNTALFSIIGTIYGGDGRTTFALPDLRGRVPLQQGQGPGLSNINLGQRSGQEYTVLTSLQLPNHTHTAVLNARREDGADFNPSGRVLAADTNASIYSSNPPDVQMSTASITLGSAGGSQQVSLRNPYLGINMIICVQGLYPSRS